MTRNEMMKLVRDLRHDVRADFGEEVECGDAEVLVELAKCILNEDVELDQAIRKHVRTNDPQMWLAEHFA